MRALHTKKLTDEKDAFVEDLYHALPSSERVIRGDLSARARTLHQTFMPLYIMKFYSRREYETEFKEPIFTGLIEAECLLILGFQNAAMSALRGAIESALRFLYYENHPIERRLQAVGQHNLNDTELREFMYRFPGLHEVSFMAKDLVEALWTELCSHVHSDLRVLRPVTIVTDISTVLEDEEAEFQLVLSQLRHVVKIISAILFAVDPKWVEHVEKVYVDAVLEAYTPSERKEVRDNLRIA